MTVDDKSTVTLECGRNYYEIDVILAYWYTHPDVSVNNRAGNFCIAVSFSTIGRNSFIVDFVSVTHIFEYMGIYVYLITYH